MYEVVSDTEGHNTSVPCDLHAFWTGAVSLHYAEWWYHQRARFAEACVLVHWPVSLFRAWVGRSSRPQLGFDGTMGSRRALYLPERRGAMRSLELQGRDQTLKARAEFLSFEGLLWCELN